MNDESDKKVVRQRVPLGPGTGISTGYTAEKIIQVWDDGEGDRFEIGPDRDGTDCVELRYHDNEGKIVTRITMHPDVWELVRKYNHEENDG